MIGDVKGGTKGRTGREGLDGVDDDRELEMWSIQANVMEEFNSATTALTNTSQFVKGFESMIPKL